MQALDGVTREQLILAVDALARLVRDEYCTPKTSLAQVVDIDGHFLGADPRAVDAVRVIEPLLALG